MKVKKKNKKAGVSDSAKAVKAYSMMLNYQGSDQYAHMSLEELEKAFDLAGARMTYAHTQQRKWLVETQKRDEEFKEVCTAYKQKKHGFTDEQIKGDPNTSTAVWTYAK